VGSEGWTSRDVETIGADVVLTSFEGITIYPRLLRREGKDTEDVLEDDSQNGGFVNQAENFLGKWSSKLMGKTGKEVEKSGSKQADINIFSVASGHLYERFIYIMIQSVLKHTQSTVKFWFIENFLSPSFKVTTTYSEL
jgi:UDP-glucose:glycoprotein glucosyltransferase